MTLLATRPATGLICMILMLAGESGARAIDLPARAPRPASSPLAPAGNTQPPLPSPRPHPGPSASTPAGAPSPLPSPRPQPAPSPDKPAAPAAQPESNTDADAPRRVTPPVPTDELACRARLRALGVDFSDHAPIDEPPGCIVAHPLTVKSLGRGIDIEPDAVLNCATTEATARFLADVVAPTAKSVFGENLVAISHGSAFVCRPRNGTTKLSEHAFGNAVDIGGFKLAGGRTINVTAATDPKEADFLSKVRMTACGPFKTVLGPGSDADHAQHFHFDLAKRRNGGTYCR
jgi:hypothetical protein